MFVTRNPPLNVSDVECPEISTNYCMNLQQVQELLLWCGTGRYVWSFKEHVQTVLM